MTHFGGPLDVVEYEKFVFWSKVGDIGDAGCLQVSLGTLGNGTRIAFVTFAGSGLDHVTGNVHRGFVGKRVEYCSCCIRHQNHVGFIDALPAGDRGTVKHFTFGEGIFLDGMSRNRNMLLLALGIGKAKIDEFNAVLINFTQHIRRGHDSISKIEGSKTEGELYSINAGCQFIVQN